MDSEETAKCASKESVAGAPVAGDVLASGQYMPLGADTLREDPRAVPAGRLVQMNNQDTVCDTPRFSVPALAVYSNLRCPAVVHFLHCDAGP